MHNQYWILLFIVFYLIGCDSKERFPVHLGQLRFSSHTVTWNDDVYLNRKYQKQIEVYNSGEKAVNLKCVGVIPEFIGQQEFHVFCKSDTTLNWFTSGIEIRPRSVDTLVFEFSPIDTNSLGFFRKEFIIEVNDTTQYQHLLMQGQVQEFFDKKDNDENMPIIHLSDSVFDFGKIYEGEKAKHEFIITNKGKSNLIIRKLETTCGCTTVRIAKTIIEPNESVVLNLVFRSSGKQGKQNKTVVIFSNDPKCAMKKIIITGEILKR